MNHLTARCWFKHESDAPVYDGAPQYVDVLRVNALVQRGRATLIPLTEVCLGRALSSLSVREGTQGDTESLPCGARSLILDSSSGEIVVRGVNKFFSYADVGDDAWVTDDELWRTCRVWATRKMAGFVVTLFSLDGETVQLISKHAAEGPHVEMAQKLLRSSHTPQQLQTLARSLADRRASLSCECIIRDTDYSHPVHEDARFDGQLVALSVQPRDSLVELSLPTEVMIQTVTEWGFTPAPAVELHGPADVQKALQCTARWSCTMHDLGLALSTNVAPLAEGLVIVVEAPCPSVSRWIRPIRLKAKTVQYVVLRSLRALITGESPLSTSSPLHGLAYHRAVLAWAGERGLDTRAMVASSGVFGLHEVFREHIDAHRQRRYRDAVESVGGAYGRLVSMTEKICAPLDRVPLTVILLTGLPGSGKTTVALALLASLRTQASPFAFAVHISRDAVTQEVAQKEHIDQHSSKHKLRRLRGGVHRAMLKQLADVVRYSTALAAPGLVVVDACHASRESRRMVRSSFPAHLDGFHVVHLYCSNSAASLERVTTRTSHEVIHDTETAQRAVYNVRRKYDVPSVAEVALSRDTLSTTPQEIVRQLLPLLHTPSPDCDDQLPVSSSVAPAARVATPHELAEELEAVNTDLLRSLVGEHALSMLAPVAPAHVSPASVAIVFDASAQDALLSFASHILHAGLFGSLPDATPTLATSVLRSVTSFFGLRKERAPSLLFPLEAVQLAAGQVKWLPNWLFGKETARDAQTLLRVLRERFDTCHGQPHVTLFYSAHKLTAARRAALTAWWQHTQVPQGCSLTVRLEELLIDRLALCFRVSLTDHNHRAHQWRESPSGFESSPLTLHITLGTASSTPPAYCGEMADLFTQWQVANDTLARDKANKIAVRSKEKFHNFARFTFTPVTTVSGLVTEDTR